MPEHPSGPGGLLVPQNGRRNHEAAAKEITCGPDLFEKYARGKHRGIAAAVHTEVPKRYGQQTKRNRSVHTQERLKTGCLMGLAVSSELAGVLLGYMVQGMAAGGALAIQYFFKDEMGVGPATLATIKSLQALPWIVRPLYGLMSDCTPLFGFHRRSYLVCSGMLASAAYVLWAIQAMTLSWAVGLWITATFCSAMVDVILDGVSCEMGRGVGQSRAGAFQSLTRLSFAMGALVTASLTGLFIDTVGFLISDIPGGGAPLTDPSAYKSLEGIAPLATPLAPSGYTSPWTSPVKEKVVAEPEHIREIDEVTKMANHVRRKPKTRMQRILRSMWSALKQSRVLNPLIFIVIFMATPQTSNALFYYYTNGLNFSPEFLAQVAVLAKVSDVASALIYARFFKHVGIRKLFLWAPILATVMGLTQLVLITGLNQQLGIPDQWFVFGDTIFIETISKTTLLHLMVLCSNLCPAGCESTMFALIMSCATASYLGFGNLGGSALMWAFGVTSTNFKNLAVLVLVCNLLHLACLPFICLIPRHVEPVVRPTFQPRRARQDHQESYAGPPAGAAQQANQCGLPTLPDSALGFTQEMQYTSSPGPQLDREHLQRKLRHLQRHKPRPRAPIPPSDFQGSEAV